MRTAAAFRAQPLQLIGLTISLETRFHPFSVQANSDEIQSDPAAVRTLVTATPHSPSQTTAKLRGLNCNCGTDSDALLTAAVIALTEAMQHSGTIERQETKDCSLTDGGARVATLAAGPEFPPLGTKLIGRQRYDANNTKDPFSAETKLKTAFGEACVESQSKQLGADEPTRMADWPLNGRV